MLHFLLEPDALREARPVLRGGGGSDAVSLPDEQQIWQAGTDFQPTYALGFDPDDPETLTTLKDALTVCRLILEQTNALFYALEAMA